MTLQFIKSVFSEPDGTGSFSRCATAVTIVCGVSILCYLIWRNGSLPDATVLAALGAWMVAPYTANSVRRCFDKMGPTPPQQ